MLHLLCGSSADIRSMNDLLWNAFNQIFYVKSRIHFQRCLYDPCKRRFDAIYVIWLPN